MGLQAGKMNERVTFLQPVTTVNDLGEQTTEWKERATVWATVKSSGGRRDDDTGEVRLTESLRVWARIQLFVTDRYRLRWRGEVYAVENLLKDYPDGQMTFTLTKL